MSGSSALIGSLVASLRTAVPMLVRTAPPSGDYLDGVLARADLQRCCALLAETLGAPIKEFGRATTLEPRVKKAVDTLGGIRNDQCLFLKQEDAERAIYAALWPWASDASRVTLKVGICTLS